MLKVFVVQNSLAELESSELYGAESYLRS